MHTNPLGETGQESTAVTLGAIALHFLEQQGANHLVELALDHGVNHIDVAPGYGTAEVKLGPKLQEHREDVFLGCKTAERTREGASEKLDQSLDRMGIEHIDLYQFHGVTTEEELDTITGEDGALETFRAARDDGVVDHIGLTSHGDPSFILECIDRIDDLETVMFPMNPAVAAETEDGPGYDAVLDRCEAEGIGTLGIKAFAKRDWPADRPEGQRTYGTWYQPVDTQAEIDRRLNFALSRGMDTITNAGDPKLVPMVLDAAERFERLDESEQRAAVAAERADENPVPATDL